MATQTVRRPQSPAGIDPGVVVGHVARLESQLEQLRAQVRQVQQIASLGAATMTLMHEVNNLLTPMTSYSQAALATNDPVLMRKALTVAAANAEILVAHAGRILQLGAAKRSSPELVVVRDCVALARESLCRDFEKDGVSFRCDIGPGVLVWFDPLQLRQIFFNLFLNAQEALVGTHSGVLRVWAQPDKGFVQIAVSDSGKGIPTDSLDRIFEPLHSSKSHDRRGPARCGGLGLALCRELAEDGGGRIRVESELGGGATFYLDLPASAA